MRLFVRISLFALGASVLPMTAGAGIVLDGPWVYGVEEREAARY